MHSVSDTPIEILSITMNILALNYIRCYGLLYRHIIPQFLPDISEMLVVLFVSTEVINVRHWEYYRFVIRRSPSDAGRRPRFAPPARSGRASAGRGPLDRRRARIPCRHVLDDPLERRARW